jgi:plastocyanin
MRRLLPLLVAAALLGWGCGGDDEDGPAAAPEPEATQAGGGADGAGEGGGGAVVVTMRDIRFDPQSVTVEAGQTVRWVNEDDVGHDADATSGADFESDLFGKGGTFEWVAEGSGTIEYVCSVHPGMTGTITVE